MNICRSLMRMAKRVLSSIHLCVGASQAQVSQVSHLAAANPPKLLGGSDVGGRAVMSVVGDSVAHDLGESVDLVDLLVDM